MTYTKNRKTMQTDERNQPHDEFHITGDWRPVTGRLLAKFEMLREEDLVLCPGMEEELLSKVANRLAIRRDEVIALIKQLQ